VKGILHPTNSLSYSTHLYDIDFPFNLLSVSQLTKSLQSEICCQLGKHLRSSFTISSHSHQSKSFDVVHTEIWGPSHISTLNGFLYFVLLIDNYSRMTILFYFLMKERSVFSKFYNEIIVQSNKRINVLRSICYPVLFIKLVVLTPLNKMVLLSKSIIIYWILLPSCCSI
jgi:hypothetical protein